jgi:hypothetical protein
VAAAAAATASLGISAALVVAISLGEVGREIWREISDDGEGVRCISDGEAGRDPWVLDGDGGRDPWVLDGDGGRDPWVLLGEAGREILDGDGGRGAFDGDGGRGILLGEAGRRVGECGVTRPEGYGSDGGRSGVTITW